MTLWSIDLETGGPDGERDAVLAVGMVPVCGGAVCLGQAYASDVRPGTGRVGSISSPHIAPQDPMQAPTPEAVVGEVDRRLSGGALVVHDAAVRLPFLKRLYRASQRRWSVPLVIDTAKLYRSLEMRARPQQLAQPVPSLRRARERVGLPPHTEHDALSGAVATAELLLVLASRLEAKTVEDLR